LCLVKASRYRSMTATAPGVLDASNQKLEQASQASPRASPRASPPFRAAGLLSRDKVLRS
jgi:hypothetical protein